MKTKCHPVEHGKTTLQTVATFLAFACLLGNAHDVYAQGTAFTYQGRLQSGTNTANGSYDLTFSIWTKPSGPSQVGNTVTNNATVVTNGLFTVTIDFGGAIFDGNPRWLEIGVRTNTVISTFNILQPRQAITPTPYALTAKNALQVNGTISSSQLDNNSVTITAGTGLSGGGNVALGNSVALANAGVIAVNGNSEISASTASGVVTLGTSAATNNVPNAIVKRDSNGGFSAGSISSAGTISARVLNLSSPGYVLSRDERFITSDGSSFFAGEMSGNTNFAVMGSANTGVGNLALSSIGGGSGNTAVGSEASKSNSIGFGNVAIGRQALEFNTSGYNNTAVGTGALFPITNGINNIALGHVAGYNFSQNCSNNIVIGHIGLPGENNTIRIGSSSQTKTYVAGIYGKTASGGTAVYVDGNGLLGTVTSSSKYKQDVLDMGESSTAILSLRPVTFHYKAELDPDQLSQFGLIAEEVEEINRDLVVHDETHGIYTVRYDAINAMLLNEFLKQHRMVQNQTIELQELKHQNELLKGRLDKIEQLFEKVQSGR